VEEMDIKNLMKMNRREKNGREKIED